MSHSTDRPTVAEAAAAHRTLAAQTSQRIESIHQTQQAIETARQQQIAARGAR